MDKTLQLALSSPAFLKKNPKVIQDIIESPYFGVLKSLSEHGNTPKDIGNDALPGVTLSFDSVAMTKYYEYPKDFSYIIHDITIPGNVPISQILHNEDVSRMFVPYANLNQTPDGIKKHIDIIRESMLRVCNQIGHTIQPENIIVNQDADNNAVLQVTTKGVANLKANHVFTDLIKKDIAEHYDDRLLVLSIDNGYAIFKYNNQCQKYPLLKDPPAQSYAIHSSIMKDPNVQHVGINIHNTYININNVTNITNNVNVNGDVNIVNNQTTQVIVMSDDSTLEGAVLEFVKSLKNEKPEWYKVGSWVHLTEARKRFDDKLAGKYKGVSSKRFNMLIKDYIGKRCEKKTIKGVNNSAVLLKPFNDIQA